MQVIPTSLLLKLNKKMYLCRKNMSFMYVHDYDMHFSLEIHFMKRDLCTLIDLNWIDWKQTIRLIVRYFSAEVGEQFMLKNLFCSFVEEFDWGWINDTLQQSSERMTHFDKMTVEAKSKNIRKLLEFQNQTGFYFYMYDQNPISRINCMLRRTKLMFNSSRRFTEIFSK